MVEAKKLTPKGKRKREAILDATLQIAIRDGLEAVSFGQLAKALKISKSGLFSHFASKDELQMAAVAHAQRAFEGEVFRSGFLDAPRGLPRLWAFCRAWLTYAEGRLTAGGCLFQALIAEYHNRPGPIRDRIKELVEAFGAAIRRLVQEAVDEGHLQDGLDLDRLSWELHALMASANHGQQLWRELGILGMCHGALRDRLRVAATPAGLALEVLT